VHDGKELDMGIAPKNFIFLLGESGARAAGTAVAGCDDGRDSAGVTLTCTAAALASASKPAGSLDIGPKVHSAI
jgi:hypothetical protein